MYGFERWGLLNLTVSSGGAYPKEIEAIEIKPFKELKYCGFRKNALELLLPAKRSSNLYFYNTFKS